MEKPQSQRLRRYLQTLKCAGCGKLFKQTGLNQFQCSPKCIPPMPLVYQLGFSLFKKFCENHTIPMYKLIDRQKWYDTVERKDWVSDNQRAKLLRLCEMWIKRFERGLCMVTPKGVEMTFSLTPYTPICPLKHHLCRGAILPGACPRYDSRCDLSKYRKSVKEPLKPWRLFFEMRGDHETYASENKQRNDSREVSIGANRRIKRPRNERPHASSAAKRTGAFGYRGKAAHDRDRLQADSTSMSQNLPK